MGMNFLHHRRIVPFIAVPLALVALAACGDDSKSSSDTTTAAAGSGTLAVEGNAYVAQSAEGITIPEGANLRIEFGTDAITVTGGCNTMSGSYSIAGDTLTVGAMMSTQMACDDALMTLDQDVAKLLAASPTLTQDGDTLTITMGSNVLVLTQEAALPVEGTTWTVTATMSKDAISSVPADAVATLVFKDGNVEVNTGCNTGSGTATIGDSSIEFGPVAITKKACSDELNTLEQQVLAVVTGTATYTVEGSSMQLVNGDNGLELSGAAS